MSFLPSVPFFFGVKYSTCWPVVGSEQQTYSTLDSCIIFLLGMTTSQQTQVKS